MIQIQIPGGAMEVECPVGLGGKHFGDGLGGHVGQQTIVQDSGQMENPLEWFLEFRDTTLDMLFHCHIAVNDVQIHFGIHELQG